MTETKHNTTKDQPLSFKQYGFPDGATSAREASFLKMESSRKALSSMGGTKSKRKRNTMKKSLFRRKTNRVKRKTNRVKRKTNRLKRKKTRGGSGGKTSGRKTTIEVSMFDVPSFNSGNSSPINANSMSKTGNSIMMQSNSDSMYDHYVNVGDIQNGGSSKNMIRNEWRKAFPPGSYGNRNTGGKKRWGCMSGGKNSKKS